MTMNMTQALAAYDQAVKNVEKGESGKTNAPAGSEFADMLKGKVNEAITHNKKAESLSLAAVAGKADLNQVVTAVAEAEFTVQAAVTIKEKVINAYKEILRMPV